MIHVFSRKSNRARILLCTFILTFAILQVSPVEVTAAVIASTDAISEDFTNTTYRDSLQTNASWWGGGSVQIPEKIARYTDFCELSDYGLTDSYVDGTMMYLAIDYGLTGSIDFVNISDPAHPVFVSYLSTPSPRCVAVSGIWMYVATLYDGLLVYNISDYQNTQLVSSFGPSEAAQVYVEGSYAYLATYDEGIQIFDVSNPQSIVSVANYTTIDTSAFRGVTKVGDYLFTLDYLPIHHDSGVHIVNVTDPANPTFVSRCTTYAYTYEIVIVDDYVFGDGPLGLFAMSISNISEPTIINNAEGIGGGRDNLVRDNENLYWCWSFGLRVVDISDPYDLQVNEINSTMDSHCTTFADGFIYTTRYVDGNEILEAHSLDWAYNAEACSLSVYETPLETFYVTQATLTATDTILASTSIDYYMSVDDGIWWEPVESGILHSFSRTGSNLKWKAILDTSIPSNTPEISSINISLKIQLKPPIVHDYSVVPIYNKPSFTWDALEGADGYRFQLDEVSTFDSPNLIDELFDSSATSYAIETPLENGTYYYRIAAIDEDGDIGVFPYPRTLSIGTPTTTTTTTTTDGTGIPLDPMILAIGAIAIIGLVAVVVIIQKRKSG